MVDFIFCRYLSKSLIVDPSVTAPNTMLISNTRVIVDDDLHLAISQDCSIAASYLVPYFFVSIAYKFIDESMIGMTLWPPFSDFYLCSRLKANRLGSLLCHKLIASGFIYFFQVNSGLSAIIVFFTGCCKPCRDSHLTGRYIKAHTKQPQRVYRVIA